MSTAIEKQREVFRAKNHNAKIKKIGLIESRTFATDKAASAYIEDRMSLGFACSKKCMGLGVEVEVYGVRI